MGALRVGALVRAVPAWVRSLPASALAVFCVALATGSAWALLTPPFQVPDEPGHFAYAQHLAQTGKLPQDGRGSYSDEQIAGMAVLQTVPMLGAPHVRVPTSGDLDGNGNLARGNGGGPTGATSQPPLYYAAEAVPYWLTAWAPLTTRLLAMRLLSVLFFALTAAVIALVAIEVLPGRSWAPVVAGLAVALSPAMGAIAGGVTPDNLMDLMAALLVLYGLRGMVRPSVRAAVVVGAIAGAGAMTKITFAALLPGALVILLVIGWRVMREAGRREALRALGAAAATALALPLVYAVWTHLSGRGLIGASQSTATLPPDQVRVGFLRDELSYIWQLYLPRMPWMDVQFPNQFPLRTTWLNGFLGRYGWLDYSAPAWLLTVGRDVAIALLALLAAGLVRGCHVISRRLPEIGALAVCVAGLLYVIGFAGYDYRNSTGYPFEQVRYLFPLAALFASAIAVACQGVGRRWAPVVAAVLVGVFSLHELSGLLLTAARYYG